MITALKNIVDNNKPVNRSDVYTQFQKLVNEICRQQEIYENVRAFEDKEISESHVKAFLKKLAEVLESFIQCEKYLATYKTNCVYLAIFFFRSFGETLYMLQKNCCSESFRAIPWAPMLKSCGYVFRVFENCGEMLDDVQQLYYKTIKNFEKCCDKAYGVRNFVSFELPECKYSDFGNIISRIDTDLLMYPLRRSIERAIESDNTTKLIKSTNSNRSKRSGKVSIIHDVTVFETSKCDEVTFIELAHDVSVLEKLIFYLNIGSTLENYKEDLGEQFAEDERIMFVVECVLQALGEYLKKDSVDTHLSKRTAERVDQLKIPVHDLNRLRNILSHNNSIISARKGLSQDVRNNAARKIVTKLLPLKLNFESLQHELNCIKDETEQTMREYWDGCSDFKRIILDKKPTLKTKVLDKNVHMVTKEKSGRVNAAWDTLSQDIADIFNLRADTLEIIESDLLTITDTKFQAILKSNRNHLQIFKACSKVKKALNSSFEAFNKNADLYNEGRKVLIVNKHLVGNVEFEYNLNEATFKRAKGESKKLKYDNKYLQFLKSLQQKSAVKDLVAVLRKFLNTTLLEEEIEKVVNEFMKKQLECLLNVFETRLDQLENIMGKQENSVSHNRHVLMHQKDVFRNNAEFAAVIKKIMLDLTDAIGNISWIFNNSAIETTLCKLGSFEFSSTLPLLQKLRNYLAHGDITLDTLFPSLSISIIDSAQHLLLHGRTVLKILEILRTENGSTHLKGVLEEEHYSPQCNNVALLIKELKTFAFWRENIAALLQINYFPFAQKTIPDVNILLRKILLQAVQQKDLTLLEFCIDFGVTIADENTWTPLHYAVFRSDLEMCRRLINVSSNTFPRDFFGITPFHLACHTGHKEIADIFLRKLEKGKTYTATKGITLLHIACYQQNFSLICHLLDCEMDINVRATECGPTPLVIAVWLNDLKTVNLLLENQASPDIAQPLDIAIQNENLEVIALLFKYKASINELRLDSRNRKSLAEAARGNVTILKMLHEYDGSHLSTLNNSGKCSAWYCVQNNQLECLKYIIDQDPAQINWYCWSNETTLLSRAKLKRHKEIEEYLKERGARDNKRWIRFAPPLIIDEIKCEVNADCGNHKDMLRETIMDQLTSLASDTQKLNELSEYIKTLEEKSIPWRKYTNLSGQTVLHISPNNIAIEFFISRDVDPNVKDESEQTALDTLFVENECTDWGMVETLISHKATFNKPGANPLLAAVNSKDPRYLKLTINKIDKSLLNVWGQAALSKATSCRFWNMMEKLINSDLELTDPHCVRICALEYGSADFLRQIKNKINIMEFPNALLHVCEHNKDYEVIKYLVEELGADVNETNKFRELPILLAAKHSRRPSIEFLFGKTERKDKFELLKYAVDSHHMDNIACVLSLFGISLAEYNNDEICILFDSVLQANSKEVISWYFESDKRHILRSKNNNNNNKKLIFQSYDLENLTETIEATLDKSWIWTEIFSYEMRNRILTSAIKNGPIQVVEKLVTIIFEAGLQDSMTKPLSVAIEMDKANVVAMLSKAFPNSITPEILDKAIAYDRKIIVTTLVNHNHIISDDVNVFSNSRRFSLSMAKHLLSIGFDINAGVVNPSLQIEHPALFNAASFASVQLFQYLLKEANIPTDTWRQCPLYVCRAGRQVDWSLLEFLLKNDAAVDKKSIYIVNRAMFRRRCDIVYTLIEKGVLTHYNGENFHAADDDMLDNLGNLLHKVCDEEFNIGMDEAVKIQKLLLQNGVSVNRQDMHGDTPLHMALKQAQLRLVFPLLEYNAFVSIENNKKQTPLLLVRSWNERKYCADAKNIRNEIEKRAKLKSEMLLLPSPRFRFELPLPNLP